MIQDQLSDYDTQAETQKRIQKKEQNASEMAQAQEQEMASGMPSPYNQQKMIAQAQEQAMQFLQVPYEQRRSMLGTPDTNFWH